VSAEIGVGRGVTADSSYYRWRADQLHLMRDTSEAYLIDKASVSVWPIPLETAATLSQFVMDVRELPDDAAVWSDVGPVLAEILDRPTAFPEAFTLLDTVLEDETTATPSAGVLPKLAINVANDCNLACSYCYANEGLYGSSRGMLKPEDASAFAERFSSTYTAIDRVQFMGGEPTMNLTAMSIVAETFDRAVGEGRLPRPPKYQIVTNGLKFSRDFLAFCVRYGVDLTISLDGPPEIHDAGRPRKNGRGSYELVRRSIEAALDAGVAIGFEPTFSRAHLRAGMSLSDLCQWFFDEFRVPVLHAPPMSRNRHIDPAKDLGLSVEEKIEQFCRVSEWGIRNLIEGRILIHDYTARILVSLAAQAKNHTVCPAGSSQLSVSMNGEVTPCWMFTDEPDYSLGSVWSEGELLGEHARERLQDLGEVDLHSHPLCKACSIQSVCFGCKGGDFHESGEFSGKPNCDYMRAMVATCISSVFTFASRTTSSEASAQRVPTFGERIWRDLIPTVQLSDNIQPNGLVYLPMPSIPPR